jgi:hypothetical protein
MKILTPCNAEELTADLSKRIRERGRDGLSLSSLDGVDAYLAGGLTLRGDVKLVTRTSGQFLVWLDTRPATPPVFVEE